MESLIVIVENKYYETFLQQYAEKFITLVSSNLVQVSGGPLVLFLSCSPFSFSTVHRGVCTIKGEFLRIFTITSVLLKLLCY